MEGEGREQRRERRLLQPEWLRRVLAPSSHLPMPAPLLCFSHLQFWLVSAGFSNGFSYRSVGEALVSAFRAGDAARPLPAVRGTRVPFSRGFLAPWPCKRRRVCWCRGALPSPALTPITPVPSPLSERAVFTACCGVFSGAGGHAVSRSEAFHISLESEVAPFSSDSSAARDLLRASRSLPAPRPCSLLLFSLLLIIICCRLWPWSTEIVRCLKRRQHLCALSFRLKLEVWLCVFR